MRMDKIATIIADDDFLVRSYLKMLPSWENAGFEIVADVRDGEEALEALKKTEAELLITDISMPLMDGIDLIKEIRKTNHKLYITVLSCHDEFEYVKEAMKEGSDDYVLKNTLDENTLDELLSSTKNKIREKNLKNAGKISGGEVFGTADISGKYRFFNGVLAGSLKGEEREQIRIRSGIKGRYQNSAVITLFLEEWEEKGERWTALDMEQYCQDFQMRLKGGLEEILEADSQSVEEIYLGKGIFCCFLDLSDMCKSSLMHQKLTSTASACYKICKNEKHTYKIGVSNICIGGEAIRQAYQQAREMVKLSFYDDRDFLNYDIDKKMGTVLPNKAKILLENVEQLIYKNAREQFQEECREVVKEFEKEMTDSRLVIQWLHQIERKAGIVHEKGEEIPHHIRQLRVILEKDIEKMFESDQDIIPEDVNKAVRVAAEFVLKHYREQIGLTEAAAVADVNPAYLSYLFQKEMKIGFSNFLLNRRMECARGMLEKTNLKVREVAEQSGFNDYHYFAKAFKKKHGVSPAEYRKNLQ